MTQEREILQQHTGSGDNVARDKIVVSGVSPESFKSISFDIMSKLSERDTKYAQEKINTLEMTGKKDAEAECLVKLLNIHMKLQNGDAGQPYYSEAVSIYSQNKSNLMLLDLAIAAIIRIDAQQARIEDAKARWNIIDTRDDLVFANEVYFECIASLEEIKSGYTKGKYRFEANQLYGLIRGALRNEDFDLALEISDQLRIAHSNFNGKVLYLHTLGRIITKEIANTHYWFISRTLRAKILKMIEGVVECLNQCQGEDTRLLSMAAFIHDYIENDNKSLNEACEKFNERILALPEVQEARIQRSKAEEAPLKDISAILLSKKISAEDAFIIAQKADKAKLKNWVLNGGEVTGEDLFVAAANMHILLQSIKDDKDHSLIEMLEVATGSIIANKDYNESSFNPYFILSAIRTMESLGLNHLVINLVQPLVKTDAWLSPITQHYLHNLLVKDQLKTLSDFLQDSDKNEWDGNIWQIKAMLEQKRHCFDEAISAWKEALKFNVNSLWAWMSLIHACEFHSPKDVQGFLHEIPESALEKPSSYGVSILLKIASHEDFSRAERIISKWFIEDPLSSCMDVSNFNLNQVMMGIEPQYSECVSGCFGGVVYERNNTRVSKILVDIETPSHDCLISIKKPLGEMLAKLKVGEVSRLGMHDYKLIERTPPFIAVARKSFELRDDNNDGNDCFFALSAPENPDELPGFLANKLNYGSDRSRYVLENREVSIMCKGHLLRPNEPVKSAFDVLGNRNNFNHQLPSCGEKNPSQVVLDIYSIIYIALSGFARTLNESAIDFIVTYETQRLLQEWIAEVSDENYLTIGLTEGGKLWRQTSDDIMKSSKIVIDEIVRLLERSQVVSPLTADMPPALMNIRKIVDVSVYSSMRLSVSNDLPWLCIDDAIAGLFNICGHKCVNAMDFFLSFSSLLSKDERTTGLYLAAVTTFPYPLTYNDLVFLSSVDERPARHYLSRALEKCTGFIGGKLNEVTNFISDLLKSALFTANANLELSTNLEDTNPCLNNDTFRLCNICFSLVMRADPQIKAESKIALLLIKMLFKLNKNARLCEYFCGVTVLFLEGHFIPVDTIIYEMDAWKARMFKNI